MRGEPACGHGRAAGEWREPARRPESAINDPSGRRCGRRGADRSTANARGAPRRRRSARSVLRARRQRRTPAPRRAARRSGVQQRREPGDTAATGEGHEVDRGLLGNGARGPREGGAGPRRRHWACQGVRSIAGADAVVTPSRASKDIDCTGADPPAPGVAAGRWRRGEVEFVQPLGGCGRASMPSTTMWPRPRAATTISSRAEDTAGRGPSPRFRPSVPRAGPGCNRRDGAAADRRPRSRRGRAPHRR